MPLEHGQTAVATDGRRGTIVSTMIRKHQQAERPDETHYVLEYVDAAGQTSQAWFPEADLTPLADG